VRTVPFVCPPGNQSIPLSTEARLGAVERLPTQASGATPVVQRGEQERASAGMESAAIHRRSAQVGLRLGGGAAGATAWVAEGQTLQARLDSNMRATQNRFAPSR
jgi:hypothetical protein